MGWSIGFHNGRDIGYGVPATCDHPGCGAEIDRGLGHVCGQEVYGGEHGCGLFFCSKHLGMNLASDDRPMVCARCAKHEDPFDPTPDTAEWITWKLTDESWQQWRDEHPAEVAAMKVTGDLTPSTAGKSPLEGDLNPNPPVNP